MAKVVGLGGVFIKAQNPQALGAFYRDQLGVGVEAWGGAQFPYRDADGTRHYSVWSPFAVTTEYFLPSDKPYMINLRVDDLPALLTQLRAQGANVLERYEESEYGRFGYVVDPEGTLIELWQPPDGGAPAA